MAMSTCVKATTAGDVEGRTGRRFRETGRHSREQPADSVDMDFDSIHTPNPPPHNSTTLTVRSHSSTQQSAALSFGVSHSEGKQISVAFEVNNGTIHGFVRISLKCRQWSVLRVPYGFRVVLKNHSALLARCLLSASTSLQVPAPPLPLVPAPHGGLGTGTWKAASASPTPEDSQPPEAAAPGAPEDAPPRPRRSFVNSTRGLGIDDEDRTKVEPNNAAFATAIISRSHGKSRFAGG